MVSKMKKVERMNQIFSAVNEEYLEKIKANVVDIARDYAENKKSYYEEVQKCLNRLIDGANKKNKKVKYICLFFLRSSILTKMHDFMMALYDERFYLDEEPEYAYLKYDFITKHIEIDFEQIKSDIAKKVVRADRWELDLVKRSIALQYYVVAGKIFQLQMNEYVKDDIWKNTTVLTEDTGIYFGEYMGELVPVYLRKKD